MRIWPISVAILALSLTTATPLVAADVPKEHLSVGLRLAFEIPEACSAREEVQRPEDPGRQISHSAIVTCGGPDLLRIDMWQDSGAGDIATWVTERLAPLVKGATRVESEAVSHLGVPGVVLERGRTPQTFSRRLVAVKIHGRVYLFTLERSGEASSTVLLQGVLTTLRILGEDGL